jgi:sialidase-1
MKHLSIVPTSLAICGLLCGGLGTAKEPIPEHAVAWTAGQEGYHTFRIPAVIVAPDGTLLAFCEGRRTSRRDDGDIDLVLKQSRDGGKTWGSLRCLRDDGANTIGNPCPIVDAATKTIWLPFCRNNDRVYVMKSTDSGATWSEPVEITTAVKLPAWSWYATGPGCGIQMKGGRLVIPCDHKENRVQHSHVFFSDDHGATWKLGGSLPADTDECQVVEREDGSLQLNMRSYHKKSRRAIATSADGGANWSPIRHDPVLIEPVCQASLVRYPNREGVSGTWLLFSNPASTRREKLTVRLSEDGGATWQQAGLLHAGPAAYSALVVLPDGSIGCLYERGNKDPYETIAFARFPLTWLRTPKSD